MSDAILYIVMTIAGGFLGGLIACAFDRRFYKEEDDE